MPSEDQNKNLDEFLKKAGELADEVIATFPNPELAEARWRQSKEARKRG